MLYLEDYLEMIEHLPQELRDRFTEIRELDLQVNNAMDSLDEEVKTFFANAKRMKPELRNEEYTKIKSEYNKTLEDAEEKVQLANQIYDLVDRYLRRLDQELAKFKIELEADNAGITEHLERRSLELDNPYPSNHNNLMFNRDHHHRRRHHLNSSNHHNNNHHHHNRDPYSNHSYTASGYHHPTLNSLNSSHHQSMGANRLNVLSPNSLTSGMVSPASSTTSNGGTNSSNLFNSQITPSIHSLGSLNSAAAGGYNSMSLGSTAPLGNATNNPIAAAASQAIAATQSMAAGRRTASLKASIDAISGPGLLGLSNDSYPIGGGYGDGQRGNKRMRTTNSSTFNDDSDDNNSLGGASATFGNGTMGELPWNLDPDEPRYCICHQVSYGEMVACDNPDCEIEWFHYACVQLTSAPKGKWYCPPCTAKMRKKNREKNSSQQSTSSSQSTITSAAQL